MTALRKTDGAISSGLDALLSQKTAAIIVTQDVFRQLAKQPEKSEWVAYKTNPTSDAKSSDLYILIPRQYAKERLGKGSLETLPEKLGLNKQGLSPIDIDKIPTRKRIKYQLRSAKKI